jgi:hypothetical protein
MKWIPNAVLTAVISFGIPAANAATVYLNDGASQSQIQSAINSASAGDIVYLNDGKYTISSPLTMKSGVKLRGSGSENTAKLTAYSVGNNVQFTISNLSDVTFQKLSFVGINLAFEGNSTHTTGLNYLVIKCIFKNTTADKFINFKYCKGGSVQECSMDRGPAYFGRGIGMYMSHDTTLDGNTITGYLDTGININGGLDSEAEVADDNKRTLNTDIINNTITRTGGDEMDHGIYVIGFKDCLIQNNTVSGWTPTGDGGCLKLRNGENIRVLDNTFNDSGILMYVYQNTYPHYLKDVTIKNNTMTISGSNSAEKARGVSYWSDVEAIEKDWWVEDNDINNGCIQLDFDGIDVPKVNGYVRNNECPIIALKSGILSSGNVLK